MTSVRELKPKIGIVADENGAVRVPVVEAASSRPRTLDAMWNLLEDLAKENAELRGSVDHLTGRIAALEGKELDAQADFDAEFPTDDDLVY